MDQWPRTVRDCQRCRGRKWRGVVRGLFCDKQSSQQSARLPCASRGLECGHGAALCNLAGQEEECEEGREGEPWEMEQQGAIFMKRGRAEKGGRLGEEGGKHIQNTSSQIGFSHSVETLVLFLCSPRGHGMAWHPAPAERNGSIRTRIVGLGILQHTERTRAAGEVMRQHQVPETNADLASESTPRHWFDRRSSPGTVKVDSPTRRMECMSERSARPNPAECPTFKVVLRVDSGACRGKSGLGGRLAGPARKPGSVSSRGATGSPS